MKIDKLDLNFVKSFLRIDTDEDNDRLQSHIDTAKNYIAVSHGYTPEEILENDMVLDLAMVIIQDLYDNGTITQQQSISFLSIDRRF